MCYQVSGCHEGGIAIVGVEMLFIKRAFGAIMISLSAISGSALAQDWDGSYAGLFLGFADGDYTLASASGVGPSVSVDGGIFGLTYGRNWQNQNMVYGFEVDISSGPDGITPQGTGGPFWSCVTGDCNASIDHLVTLRGRYGWTSGTAGLFFVTGGLAVGDVSGGILNSVQQGSGTTVGFTVGLGYEHMVGAQSSVRLDALYVDLGDIPFGTGLGVEEFYGDGDFSMVRLGWNFHF